MERALRHVLHFSLDAMGVDLVGEAFAKLRWSGKEAKKEPFRAISVPHASAGAL